MLSSFNNHSNLCLYRYIDNVELSCFPLLFGHIKTAVLPYSKNRLIVCHMWCSNCTYSARKHIIQYEKRSENYGIYLVNVTLIV